MFAAVAIVVVAAGALSSCAKPAPRYAYRQEPDPRQGEFVLGPSDELRITVWRNPDLSTDATVRPDGTITMPLIGDLPAAGRTTRMLRNEIMQRLKAYVKEGAVVTVALARVRSYCFTVAGRVDRVGLFTESRFVTVAEAIAMAGGPTRFADASHALVIRRDRGGRLRKIPIDYNAIASGTRPEQNVVILPGDTIYVP